MLVEKKKALKMYPNETSQLFFDPDKHPEDTLKAFQEFVQTFELRYNAQYPDPPTIDWLWKDTYIWTDICPRCVGHNLGIL